LKGQVFTVAKLHYINGVVYAAAEKQLTDLKFLATRSSETTPSGNVKHPLVRVRTLARLAEGLSLITIEHKSKVEITALGKKYYEARSRDKWALSKAQKQLLCKYILADYYRTETIYAIAMLFELVKKGYSGKKLELQYSIEIGKEKAWKSAVTFAGFTKFGLDYICELGLLNIGEKDLLIADTEREVRYQKTVNEVEPVAIPVGSLPRPMPKKYGKAAKYQSNPRRARNALITAEYKCEIDPTHFTFVNKKSGKQYMEAHHLIPMGKQRIFEYDIDVPENILCLCPNCHRKIHLSEDIARQYIVKLAYESRKHLLPSRGIQLELLSLLEFYEQVL
jgi:hypothetical protein